MIRGIFLPLLASILLCVGVAAADDTILLVIDATSIDRVAEDIGYVTKALELELAPEQLKGIIGMGLHSPMLSGIDTTRDLRIIVFMPDIEKTPPEAPGVVFCVPVTDNGAQYLSSLTRMLGASQEVNGMYQFAGRSGPQGVSAPPFAMAAEGDQAIVGSNPNQIDQTRTLIRKKAFIMPKVVGTLRMNINAKALRILVDAGLKTATDAMDNAPPEMQEQMQNHGPFPGMTMDTRAVLEAQGDAVRAVLAEIRDLTIGISANAKALQLCTRLRPVEDSTLARMIARGRPPAKEYMTMLPPDSFFATAMGGLDAFEEIAEPYGDLVEKIYAGTGEKMAPFAAALKKNMTQMKGLYSGDVAMGVIPDPSGGGVGFVEVIGVNDPVKARSMISDTMRSLNEAGGETTQGIKVIEGKARRYDGVQITSYHYNVVMPENLQDPSAAMAMKWMENFGWEMAFVGRKMIYTIGKPGIMDATIDSVKAKTTHARVDQSGIFADLFSTTRGEPVSMFYVAPTKLLRAILASIPNAQSDLLPASPTGTGGMAGYSVNAGADRLAVMRFGLAELPVLKNAPKVLTGLLLQSALQGMAGEGMQAGPGTGCVNNLRMIDAAKDVFALDHDVESGRNVTVSDLEPYLKGARMPVCPQGGIYSINPVGAKPECTVPGHELR